MFPTKKLLPEHGSVLPELFILLVAAICGYVVIWTIDKLNLHDNDPLGFEEFLSRTLGFRVSLEGESAITPFPVTYWNGAPADFWVPVEVWTASVAAGFEQGCDPELLVATAFSESTQYNNTAVSPTGAAGVWQFMPSTWDDMWEGDPPPRQHIPSAADAACRYLKKTGSVDAVHEGRDAFIDAFAVTAPVWNRHEEQAGFVYDLYTELKARDQGTTTPFAMAQLEPAKWYAPIVLWWLDQLGILPVFKFASGVPGPGGDSDESGFSGFAFEPLPFNSSGIVIGQAVLGWIYGEGWGISQGPHGESYGHLALDVICHGCTIFSPIDGEVTAMYTDGYGNTVIHIENDDLLVTILHGDFWGVQVGDSVDRAQAIGTESNNGNTWSGDQYCGTGSDCGNHSHLNVYNKDEGKNEDPLDLFEYAAEQAAEEEQQRQLEAEQRNRYKDISHDKR